MSDENLKVVRICDALALAASATKSFMLDISTLPLGNWKFTYEMKITGTGTGAATFKHSLDGVNFVTVAANDTIIAGVTAAAVSFGAWTELPLAAKWLEITVAETGGANAIVVTLDIGVA